MARVAACPREIPCYNGHLDNNMQESGAVEITFPDDLNNRVLSWPRSHMMKATTFKAMMNF